MKYQIIDNFLNEKELESINKMLYSDNFAWFYVQGITEIESKGIWDYVFIHNLYNYRFEHPVNSDWFGEFAFLFLTEGKIPDYSMIQRMKVNCYTNQAKNHEHGIHVDNDEPHKVALWNATTNDGKTLLYIDDDIVEVPSIENQMIIFDGDIKHQSIAHTTTDLRINVYINYTPKG